MKFETEAKPKIGRLCDQLIPRLCEPKAKPMIVLRQIGRLGDQLIPVAKPNRKVV